MSLGPVPVIFHASRLRATKLRSLPFLRRVSKRAGRVHPWETLANDVAFSIILVPMSLCYNNYSLGLDKKRCLSRPFSRWIWSGLIRRRSQVEPIKAHHLVPRRDEVIDELFLRIQAGVDLGQGAELRV
jgi:hypothetical protein